MTMNKAEWCQKQRSGKKIIFSYAPAPHSLREKRKTTSSGIQARFAKRSFNQRTYPCAALAPQSLLQLRRKARGWLLAALTVTALVGACGHSLSYTVDADLLKRLPKKSRRSVFQARTVVTIAIDRKSSVKRKIDACEREISRIAERIAKLEKQLGDAGPQQAQRLEGEIQMLAAKKDFLGEKHDYLEHKLEVAELEVVLARAQFELAKVRLVKKHSIAFDGDEADFVEQVEDLQKEVKEARKELAEHEAELKREEQKWLAVKKRFYSSIGESAKGWWTE